MLSSGGTEGAPFELSDRYGNQHDYIAGRLEKEGFVVIEDVISIDSYQSRSGTGMVNPDYVLVPSGVDFTTIKSKLPEPLPKFTWELFETFELDGSARIGTPPRELIRAAIAAEGFFKYRNRKER